MPKRETVDDTKFNSAAAATMPYNLRLDDFRIAMQDIYDFYDVNTLFETKVLTGDAWKPLWR